MQCPPCHALMKIIDYTDARDQLPLVWMKGWRCEHCGLPSIHGANLIAGF